MDSVIPEAGNASNPYLNRIRIVQGNIARQDTDAIVTVIPQTLEYRGAINAAIVESAGARLDKFVLENIVTPRSGDIYAVPGFDLPCRHVFYCVVPVWQDDFDRNDRDLVRACRTAMELARSMGLRSIAFPPVGSGKRGFPKARAARLILQGITSRMSRDIDEVRIVCQNGATMRCFKDCLMMV